MISLAEVDVSANNLGFCFGRRTLDFALSAASLASKFDVMGRPRGTGRKESGCQNIHTAATWNTRTISHISRTKKHVLTWATWFTKSTCVSQEHHKNMWATLIYILHVLCDTRNMLQKIDDGRGLAKKNDNAKKIIPPQIQVTKKTRTHWHIFYSLIGR